MGQVILSYPPFAKFRTHAYQITADSGVRIELALWWVLQMQDLGCEAKSLKYSNEGVQTNKQIHFQSNQTSKVKYFELESSIKQIQCSKCNSVSLAKRQLF